MLNQKNLSNKRLSLISIGLLTLSLFLLISTVSAQTDNWQTSPDFATANNNLMWQLAPNQPAPQQGEYVWVIPVENNTPLTPPPEPDNTWTYIILGASVFFVLLTTVNLVKTKHIKINKGATLLTVCLLSISMFTILPMTAADQTEKTGYKLATPTGEWDYQIRNYTDSTYGVVRGSDWANLMTYVGSSGGSPITPPWAGFTDDAEAVWDAIFSTIEYGVVYGKEVAPVNASGLDVWQSGIPDNVEVVSSYQGNEYKFTNPTNTAGSPYTVSVGAKVMDGYYTAEDSKGRILWSSTDASTLIQSTISALSRGIIFISEGTFYASNINTTSLITIMGAGEYKTNIVRNADKPIFNLKECTGTANNQRYTIISDMTLDGGNVAYDDCVIYADQIKECTFKNLDFANCAGDAFYITGTNAVRSFWNTFDNIMHENPVASTGATFNIGTYAIDSYVSNVEVNRVKNIVKCLGNFGGWQFTNLWGVECENTVYLNASDNAIGGWHFTEVRADTNTQHGIYIEASNYNIVSLFFDKVVGVLEPSGYDLVHFKIASGHVFSRIAFNEIRGDAQTGAYIFSKEGDGTINSLTINKNYHLTPASGRYNGIQFSSTVKTVDDPYDSITEPMGAYSYIIYIDPLDSDLYHVKAANGTILFTSTNFGEMCNLAFNASDGGDFYIAAGHYYINTTDYASCVMQPKSNTKIWGAGDSTIIETIAGNDQVFALGSYFPTVQKTVENIDIGYMKFATNSSAYGTGIGIPLTNTIAKNIYLHDLTFTPNGRGAISLEYEGNAIPNGYLSGLTVDRVTIKNANKGIQIARGIQGGISPFLPCDNITIRNSIFDNCTLFAVGISGASNGIDVTNVLIDNCKFFNCGNYTLGYPAITLNGNGRSINNVWITNNVFNGSVHTGIIAYFTANMKILNNVINSTVRYPIYCPWYNKNLEIAGNIITAGTEGSFALITLDTNGTSEGLYVHDNVLHNDATHYWMTTNTSSIVKAVDNSPTLPLRVTYSLKGTYEGNFGVPENDTAQNGRTLGAGVTTYTATFSAEMQTKLGTDATNWYPSGILFSFDAGTYYISAKATTGFTITFTNATPDANQKIYYDIVTIV